MAATEFRDWASPRTTPCSLREVVLVIKLVSTGRSVPVPKEAKVVATSSSGMP